MRVDLDKHLDKDVFHTIKTVIDYPPELAWNKITVDCHYFEHALSRISRYLKLFSRSLQHLQSTFLENVSLSPIPLSRIIRYFEPFFLSLGRITVAISNFSENIAHRYQSMKIFSCVVERVCLIEYYFN